MVRLLRQQGISLIETVIVVGIFTLVMVVLLNSIIFFYRSNTYAIEQAFAVESARRGVEIMVRDIREASYSDEGQFPIISIGENEIEIYSDIDRDDDVERVHFFLDSATNQFMKVTTNSTGTPATYTGGDTSTSTVASDVRNELQDMDIFRYFDDSGTEIIASSTANVTEVAFIQVSMIVNINPLRLPNEFVLRSSATLRNLKENL